MYGFDWLEALLDGRLPFMDLEDLGSSEIAVVGNERIDALALLVVIDRGLIDRPFQVIAPTRDLHGLVQYSD